MIFIGQNIDEEFSNQILATMLYLDTLDDSRRIYMYLNGPGGDVSFSFTVFFVTCLQHLSKLEKKIIFFSVANSKFS